MNAYEPFSIVAKPNGAGCNLDCDYCFFLSKELLHDTKRQEMTIENLETYISRYLQASPDGDVTLLWQGGEPTLRGLDFFRSAVKLGEELRRPGQTVHHAIQTNATLIDQEWARFLAKEDFLVGVSIDGSPQLHDIYRHNLAGRGTYGMVRKGWKNLEEAGVRRNILCTINAANQDFPLEVYRHFRDELGAQFIQFIPIVERSTIENRPLLEAGWQSQKAAGALYTQEGGEVTSRTVSPEKYGRFLKAVFDEWVKNDVGEVFIQDFDSALSALFDIYPTCVHAVECGNNLAMNFNGDVYACDHWVEPQWQVGNVIEGSVAQLLDSAVLKSFAAKKRAQLPEKCISCPVLKLCNGGCPKDRFVKQSRGSDGNYLCEGYFGFFSAAAADLKAMATLVKHGLPASAIMDRQVREQLCPTQEPAPK